MNATEASGADSPSVRQTPKRSIVGRILLHGLSLLTAAAAFAAQAVMHQDHPRNARHASP